MTTVTFEPYYDTHMFQCSGHSGYGARGCDIVCSAVSVLCYTLGDFLSRCEAEGRVKNLKTDFSEGNVYMEFEISSAADTGVSDGVEAVLGGFRLLSENYPDYVTADL